MNDDYFGVCPICHKADGYLNAGKSHTFYCAEHKTCWHVGSNIFSSWRDETEEEQKQKWDQVGMDHFKEVEPAYPSRGIKGGDSGGAP